MNNFLLKNIYNKLYKKKKMIQNKNLMKLLYLKIHWNKFLKKKKVKFWQINNKFPKTRKVKFWKINKVLNKQNKNMQVKKKLL